MPAISTEIPRVLTIAGSDSGGGAGIQADLKTFTALGVYGASVVTALTAQNTLGVQGLHTPPTSFVQQQLTSVLSDIGFQIVKTGMIPNADMIRLVAETLRQHNVPTIIIDPVLIATSGDSLVSGEESMSAMVAELFPLATLVTPNLPEASKLTGQTIRTVSDMREACMKLIKMGCNNVLLKGGHLAQVVENGNNSLVSDIVDNNLVTDILYDGHEFQAFVKPRIDSNNTHGTGCTLASAIAAEMAKGKSLGDAVGVAKEYVYTCIVDGLNLGGGHGPLNHMVHIQSQFR